MKVGIDTGCLVALSSTAIVLKLLSDRGETASPTGEVAIAFLIFQDIAVVIMVLLVSTLGEGGGDAGELIEAVVKSLILIGGVVVATRFVVPPLLGAASAHTNNEEFLLAVLAVAIGVGYLVTLLGLSASLGIIKIVTTGVAAKALARPWPIVAASALLLAQLGEFSFVLERAGREVGLSPFDRGADGAQTFIATSVLLFALTPLLHRTGQALRARLVERFPSTGEQAAPESVVVIGPAPRTQDLVEVIERDFPDVPLVVADATTLESSPAPRPTDERPPVRLLVIDGSSGPVPDVALGQAVRADPPIPVVYRAPTSLDVDHLRGVEGVELVVDESTADGAFVEAVRRALADGAGSHGH